MSEIPLSARDRIMSVDSVTRIELISEERRVVTKTARAVQVTLQDDGRTLKIFYEDESKND